MDRKREIEIMKQNDAANRRHVEEWKAEMEKDKMLAVFLNVYGDYAAQKVKVEHSLEAWYELLGCHVVEMPTRWIGDRQYVIICDEEGTFRSDCRVSACDGARAMLVGNLLVVADAGDGEIRGLTEEEANHVMQHVGAMARTDSRGHYHIWPVLMDVTYGWEDN